MPQHRIYVVTVSHGKEAVKHHLVRAPNAAQAIRHVAKPMFSAEVASQDDLVKLIGEGAKVEESGEGA